MSDRTKQPQQRTTSTSSKPEPTVPPYNVGAKLFTKDSKVKLNPDIFDEKLARYEALVWANKEGLDRIQDHLTERKDDCAEKLILHASNYQGFTRGYITKLSELEEEAQNDYYDIRKEMKNNFRLWRKRYIVLLNDSVQSKNLRASLKNPEFSKFLRADVTSHITDSGWENILIQKNAISKYNTKLGEGGFGRVFRGIVHGTVVAVKEIKEETAANISSKISAFEAEIRIFSTLQHENILKFMGACLPVGGAEEVPYYALLTELAENGSLHDALYKKQGVPVKFSFSKKMKIIGEIVSGMLYLHGLEKPVYHLDLKCANILLDSNYSVRIADFGLSRILTGGNLMSGGMSTFVGGTPFYMSPEILKGEFDLNQADKADIYAFAILVNELLDEKQPYYGLLSPKAKMADLIAKVTKGEEQKQHRPALAQIPELTEMIKDCWRSDPGARPTFKDLRKTEPWNIAKITAANTDKSLTKILEEFVKDKDKKGVKFSKFVRVCSEQFSEPQRLFLEKDDGPFDAPYIRTLLAVLDMAKGTDDVPEENVRRMITWIGKARKNEYLDLLYSLFSKDYFFGIMEDSVDTFGKSPKAGTFLVRWSNQNGMFFLDYIPKKKDKKGGELTEIQALPLKVVSISDLEQCLPTTLAGLGISKESVAGNRPVRLVTLKIKEKFVTGDNAYQTAMNPGATGLAADLSRGQQCHYNFIF
jgi:serine/threonine protein kinase